MPSSQQGMRKIFLLIEHNKEFAQSIVAHLQRYGFSVVTSDSKTKAFQLCCKTQPHVILIQEEFHNVDLLMGTKFNHHITFILKALRRLDIDCVYKKMDKIFRIFFEFSQGFL